MFKNPYLRYGFYVFFILITAYLFMVLTPDLLSGSSAQMMVIIAVDVVWFLFAIYVFVKGKGSKK